MLVSGAVRCLSYGCREVRIKSYENTESTGRLLLDIAWAVNILVCISSRLKQSEQDPDYTDQSGALMSSA